jgi:hypothetical protein
MKPAGAADRAPDGFLPLAAPLPFGIATAAVEVERNDLRRSRAVAEKTEVMGRMGAEYCTCPERLPLITRRVGR